MNAPILRHQAAQHEAQAQAFEDIGWNGSAEHYRDLAEVCRRQAGELEQAAVLERMRV